MTVTPVDHRPARALARGSAAEASADLVRMLKEGLNGRPASAVLWFASSGYDPLDLAGPLAAAFPGAAVIGCSTAGEFTDGQTGTGGLSGVALPEGVLVRAAAALGDLSADVAAGTDAAISEVERALGAPLRGLDPARNLGFVLIDGMHGWEEEVNERLGNAAPVLDIVGGSAGDDLAFDRTWVAVGDRVSYDGVALLVAETAVPFRVVKTCSFTPSGTRLAITRADSGSRTVWEFDGVPAVEAYARAVGIEPAQVGVEAFMKHPVGLMIDGEPWIRSPQQTVPGGGLKFYAAIPEGMVVDVMDAGDLVSGTARAVREARAEVGGGSGAVMFNCILRRLEMDADGTGEDFVAAFGDLPVGGFHTYGETWLGHVNQTLTGVVFG